MLSALCASPPYTVLYTSAKPSAKHKRSRRPAPAAWYALSAAFESMDSQVRGYRAAGDLRWPMHEGNARVPTAASS